MNRFTIAEMFLMVAAVAVGGCSHHPGTTSAAAAEQTNAWQRTAGSATSSSQMKWVSVRDQQEQAFSVDVPQGWKTYGGLFRFSTIDVRMLVDETSPDGLTNIRLGDSTIPPYRVPGPFLKVGPGVAPYVQGRDFATRYGQARFASMCQGLQVKKNDTMAPKYHSPGGGFTRTTAGEAFFSCTKSGVPVSAYVYAETMMLGPGSAGSMWMIVALGSVIAPTQTAVSAGALLKHSGESLVMNPTWMQAQNHLNEQAIQQINASTQATIAATNTENARERGMISALDNSSINDVINGVQQAQDTSTGKRYVVPLGTGGTQWVNDSRAVVESGLSPGPGFNRVTPINR